MVLTHIYLLAGCGISLWLCTHSVTSRGAAIGRLFNLAGVLATGVGDAMGGCCLLLDAGFFDAGFFDAGSKRWFLMLGSGCCGF